MHTGHMNYLPLSPLFFLGLAGALLALVILVQIGLLRFAYYRLGVGPGAATLLLLASLIGSYINIPVYQLPPSQVASGQEVAFFGMIYVVPVVESWPGTVIAVNAGGAIVPGLLSLYLLVHNQLWLKGALATIAVAIVCHLVARPVPGVGIAEPIFIPPIASALVAILLSRTQAAPLAYIGGSLGALIGADLTNLDKVDGLGAPIASIGGAGTYDGIFVTGVLAVIIASLTDLWPSRRRAHFASAPPPR